MPVCKTCPPPGKYFKTIQGLRAHKQFCPGLGRSSSPAQLPARPPASPPAQPAAPPSAGSSARPPAQPASPAVQAAEDRVRLERAELELERLERERDAQARNDLETVVAQARQLNRQRTIRDVLNVVVPPWGGDRMPADLRARARERIEARLSTVPVSELSPSELIAIAKGVRDEVYRQAGADADARRRQEEEERRQAIAPPQQSAPPQQPAAPQQPAPPPVTPAAAPASPLIARPTAPAPTTEAGGGQARKKDALVQRGVDRVEQDLNLRDDLDLDTKAEIWDRVTDQLEERLTGTEDAADADELADELLAEEFGDEPDEDDDEGS